MCGIAGFIDPNTTTELALKQIGSMLEAIAHRGPDNRGTWCELPVAFGHNRLSIIDLSDAAHQPMVRDSYVITYNGEIYNYIELRKELATKGHSFVTNSDTEVVLAAYKEWGPYCVDHFVGMWAMAIWDDVKQELFCSRDRFGIKPLYFMHHGKEFYFASEFGALQKLSVFSSDVNIDQVSRFLQMGWLGYQEETFYEQVRSLPAAHNLIYSNGKVNVSQYWDIDANKLSRLKDVNVEEKFQEMFLESVNMHMRSDVPVASCLSGGLDSSSIVSAVSKMNPESDYNTFSIYYTGKDDVDERPHINEVLRQYPNLKAHYYSPRDEELNEAFHSAMRHCEVPAAGSSFMSQYFLMKLIASEGVKVVLDGQGADEYLGGYMHSFYRTIGGKINAINPFGALHQWRSFSKAQQYGFGKSMNVLAKSMLTGFKTEQQLYEMEYHKYFPFMISDMRRETPFKLKYTGGSKLNSFLYHLLFTTSLPSLLHYEDRNSMAFSVESRVPFLDHRLVTFAFSLPDEYKIENATTKAVLRDAMQGILPERIITRKDKKGFVTPGEVKWLRGPLKHLINADFKHLDFLDKRLLEKEIDEFKLGNNKNATLVWRLATLNYWMKQL